MEPIHLAFLWHQHQPLYKDVVQGRYYLPWVRLHAIKDYIGMLLVLREFPEIRATFNLVPSLIIQIEEYAAGQAEDETLRLTRKPAEGLTEAERRTVLDTFFAGNPDRLIRVFPRYRELFELRNEDTGAGPLLSHEALRDLQVWATLAWFHPLVVESDDVLKELRRKGRHFSEEDKSAMLERQDAVLSRVLPLHRELLDAGQIEISTTPYYHPILPLLCNMESAREAMPDLPMPEHRTDFTPDAEIHLTRAIELHERVFGQRPTGMWPAEGSVSMDILPLLRGRGLKWIATDEQILARSTQVNLSRDGTGILKSPDGLYQPYALPGEGDLPAILFRDHVLSDAIGFEYHHGEAGKGAENFVGRIRESARRCGGRPRLVPIILDGENPWDSYDEAGLAFLRELYGRLTREKAIVTTRLTDYLRERPPQNKLDRLAAGSWIDSNFAIWMGTQEDRNAWSLLAKARETLAHRIHEEPSLPDQTVSEAWEQIYIAEGSDWFWGLGGDRTAAEDYLFDELFRNHIANAYRLIGEQPPPELDRPIGKPARAAAVTQPLGMLEVTLNGQANGSAEWAAAGILRVVDKGSAMRRSASEPVTDLYFGFGPDNFLLRLDAEGSLADKLTDGSQIVVRFSEPAEMSVTCDLAEKARPALHLHDAKGKRLVEPGTLALGSIMELSVPLNLLATRPGNEINFYAEILRAGAVVQRIPLDGEIRTTVPSNAPAKP